MSGGDEVEPLPLVEILLQVVEMAHAIDSLDEHVTAHRHRTDDSADVVELHAVGDALTQAWAYLQQAGTALTEYVAVRA